VAAAAQERLGELGRPASIEEVRSAIEPAFTDHPLPAATASPPSLIDLGRTIAERALLATSGTPPPDEAAPALLPGPIRFIADAARKVAETADDIVSGVVDLAGGAFMQIGREQFLKSFGEGIGDVLYYQAHQEDIQNRIESCIQQEGDGYGFTPDRPIPVVAHSLGGIIAWDMAIRPHRPLYVDPLVTFGSQSAIIEIFSPRPYKPWQDEGNFKGVPLLLPSTITRWFNFWDPLDPLAYSAQRVFRTSVEGGVKDVHDPWDGAVKDAFSHDDYWRDPVFQAAVMRIIGRTA
jgi:hypothetical protein